MITEVKHLEVKDIKKKLKVLQPKDPQRQACKRFNI